MLDERAWLAICFTIFVIVFYKPIKKAILSFLDNRILQIRNELGDARKAKEAANAKLQEIQERLNATEKKHREMITSAKLEIEKIFEERCKGFEKSLEYRRNAAEERISQMQKEALEAMEKEFLSRVASSVSSYFQSKNSADLDLAIISSIPQSRQNDSN